MLADMYINKCSKLQKKGFNTFWVVQNGADVDIL